MPLSESRKRANSKWDKENLKMLVTKVRRDDAEKFAQLCKENNLSVHKAIKSFVMDCLSKNAIPVYDPPTGVQGQIDPPAAEEKQEGE